MASIICYYLSMISWHDVTMQPTRVANLEQGRVYNLQNESEVFDLRLRDAAGQPDDNDAYVRVSPGSWFQIQLSAGDDLWVWHGQPHVTTRLVILDAVS